MNNYNWSFLDSFNSCSIPEHIPSWDNIDMLVKYGINSVNDALVPIRKTLKKSIPKLEYLGGDPLLRNWIDFRPLRLDREEDWSDWLAFLIKTSKFGFLSRELINNQLSRPIDVKRELPTVDCCRRADIVIFWENNWATQIEVKIGDNQFEKTFETAEGLHKDHQSYIWTDRILLMNDSIKEWDELKGNIESRYNFCINTLTWTQVVIAIRAFLLNRKEDITWLVWASSFCGAVEQQILELPMLSLSKDYDIVNADILSIAGIQKQTKIIEEAENYG